MTRQVTATEAKARLLSLLDEVMAGAEVEITRHGRTAARLVPAAGARGLKGRFVGVASSVSDDDALFTTGLAWTFE